MTQWRFAVPALVVVSLFSTVTARAASRTQPDDTRLPVAAQNGDQAEVQALLKAHVSVDSAEGDGSTALHWAAYQNNLALAQELLNAHANVNAVTRLESLTPLYMACESGSAPMVELLLKHGANVNQADGLGTTPLMMAAASGNAAVVKVLLDHGADVNAKEHAHDQTALMFAANLDRADVIPVLLAHGADPNAVSKVVPAIQPEGGQGAAFKKRAEEEAAAAKAAAAKKAGAKDASVKDAGVKDAGVKDAGVKDAGVKDAGVKDAGVKDAGVKDAGAKDAGVKDASAKDAGVKDASAKDAGVKDASAKDAGVKDASVDSGKMPLKGKAKDKDETMGYHRDTATKIGGMTPLLFAARQGNIPAGEALVAGGANINEVSGSEHTTPLVLAIMNGHYDFAKMLVEHGADVNLANDMGVAPLWATEDVQYAPIEWSPEPVVTQEKTNYLSLMKLLLSHGENPNARIKQEPWERAQSENQKWTKDAGATAFYRAAQAWDVPAMKVLKDNGADPTIPTNLGTTPLMAAAGLGWAPMYTTTAAPTTMAAVQYCIGLGENLNTQDKLGYTALHGAAFIGDLKVIQYLVDHGEKTGVKAKNGDTAADMANGPFEKSQLHPEAVALLVKLGDVNSNNCRSSVCVIATNANTHLNQPAEASTATADSKKPAAAADSKTPAADSTTPMDVTLTTGKKPGK